MKTRINLIAIIFLFHILFCNNIGAKDKFYFAIVDMELIVSVIKNARQRNLFIDLPKKSYVPYSKVLEKKVYRYIYPYDFLRASRTVGQMREMATEQAEKMGAKDLQFRLLLFVISGFMTVILALLALLGYFYWKMVYAYHDLVRKNRLCDGGELLEKTSEFQPENNQRNEVIAHVNEVITIKNEVTIPEKEDAISEIVGTNNKKERREPTEKEVDFTARIHQMMVSQQLYRDSGLSLESLAQLLGVNRETVSRSINRTTGKNFSYFLNEYRIKEAVRLLSNARNRVVNFDELSEQVGFNNRITFHRAFKQITGLPPNGFKNNS